MEFQTFLFRKKKAVGQVYVIWTGHAFDAFELHLRFRTTTIVLAHTFGTDGNRTLTKGLGREEMGYLRSRGNDDDEAQT